MFVAEDNYVIDNWKKTHTPLFFDFFPLSSITFAISQYPLRRFLTKIAFFLFFIAGIFFKIFYTEKVSVFSKNSINFTI